MDERLMTFLEAIKAYGNMTNAAQSLFVSQPYISRTIREAEKKYHVTLLDRSQQPLELTYAGERLLFYLVSENHLKQALKNEMSAISQDKNQSLTLGITPPLANTWFPLILPDFYRQFPHVHIKIVEISTSEAEPLLINRKLDLFIGKTVHKPSIASHPLTTVALSLLIPASAKLYRSGVFWRKFELEKLAQLNNENFIRSTDEHRFQELVDHYLADKGINVNPLIEVGDSELALQLTLKGLGSIVAPTSMVAKIPTAMQTTVNAFKIPLSQLSIDFSVSFYQTTFFAEPLEFLIQQTQKKFNSFITDIF